MLDFCSPSTENIRVLNARHEQAAYAASLVWEIAMREGVGSAKVRDQVGAFYLKRADADLDRHLRPELRRAYPRPLAPARKVLTGINHRVSLSYV